MKKLISIFILVPLSISISLAAETPPTSNNDDNAKYSLIQYPSSGSATIIIERPISEVFNTLTNVTEWPNINKGVTQAITPTKVDVKKGATFKETIASPIPGIENWTKELTVEEYIPNKLFVISGIDTFAPNAPIFARLKYEFKENSKNSTLFKRTIEVDITNSHFIQKANKQEIESLYRFLGSQWEMANHLKKYTEENTNTK